MGSSEVILETLSDAAGCNESCILYSFPLIEELPQLIARRYMAVDVVASMQQTFLDV